MRVCLVSHRLGGFDGVSVEAAKWAAAFRSLGWPVTRAAGYFADREPGDVEVRGLWADRPGGEPPPVDDDVIERLCRTHDLLVLDNAGSLWSAPLASLAFQRYALAAGIPTIVRHHDPAWQGTALRESADVPLHHPAFTHVVINELTRGEFLRRHGLEPRVVHNRVDVDGLASGDRERTRARMGVAPGEALLVHPARVEAANKNIPGAVAFAHELARLTGPVRYWLTDLDTPSDPAVAEALDAAPGLLRGRAPSQADMYAACDLVLLPSTWEGWGLPVVEAAAAGRPVVAGPYPVLAEIRAFGLTVFDPSEVAAVADTLARPVNDTDRALVRSLFDIGGLPGELRELAAEAAR